MRDIFFFSTFYIDIGARSLFFIFSVRLQERTSPIVNHDGGNCSDDEQDPTSPALKYVSELLLYF